MFLQHTNKAARLFLKPASVLPGLMKVAAFSTQGADVPVCYEQLQRRQLLRIGGEDAPKFLQGLITNDISHLDHGTDIGTRGLYCMFLNPQGRVLYDTIIYRTVCGESENSFYLMECEKVVAPELKKYLARYKLRKKVDIADVSNEYDLWVVYQDPNDLSVREISNRIRQEKDAESVRLIGNFDFKLKNGLWACRDPRLSALGWRIISPCGKEPELSDFKKVDHNLNSYLKLRLKLGVGEGVEDFPQGGCFALESNTDYLHGVSFTKGCYVGQELTARTHHTGVVRRRLMPLIFETEVTKLECGKVSITNPSGQKVGKFRCSIGQFGLGSLRIAESVSAEVLNIKESDKVVANAVTFKPYWWPIEITKERLVTKK